jgi:hypothetical protein
MSIAGNLLALGNGKHEQHSQNYKGVDTTEHVILTCHILSSIAAKFSYLLATITTLINVLS